GKSRTNAFIHPEPHGCVAIFRINWSLGGDAGCVEAGESRFAGTPAGRLSPRSEPPRGPVLVPPLLDSQREGGIGLDQRRIAADEQAMGAAVHGRKPAVFEPFLPARPVGPVRDALEEGGPQQAAESFVMALDVGLAKGEHHHAIVKAHAAPASRRVPESDALGLERVRARQPSRRILSRCDSKRPHGFVNPYTPFITVAGTNVSI